MMWYFQGQFERKCSTGSRASNLKWICQGVLMGAFLCVVNGQAGSAAGAWSDGKDETTSVKQEVENKDVPNKLSKLKNMTVTLEHPEIEPLNAQAASFIATDIKGKKVKIDLISDSEKDHLWRVCIDDKCLDIDKVFRELRRAQSVRLAESKIFSWYYKSDMIPHFAIYIPFGSFSSKKKKCNGKLDLIHGQINTIEIVISEYLSWSSVSIVCMGDYIYSETKVIGEDIIR